MLMVPASNVSLPVLVIRTAVSTADRATIPPSVVTVPLPPTRPREPLLHQEFPLIFEIVSSPDAVVVAFAFKKKSNPLDKLPPVKSEDIPVLVMPPMYPDDVNVGEDPVPS